MRGYYRPREEGSNSQSITACGSAASLDLRAASLAEVSGVRAAFSRGSMLDRMVGRSAATRPTGWTRGLGAAFGPGETLTAGAGGMSAPSLYVTVGVGEGDRGSVNPITGVRRISGRIRGLI